MMRPSVRLRAPISTASSAEHAISVTAAAGPLSVALELAFVAGATSTAPFTFTERRGGSDADHGISVAVAAGPLFFALELEFAAEVTSKMIAELRERSAARPVSFRNLLHSWLIVAVRLTLLLTDGLHHDSCCMATSRWAQEVEIEWRRAFNLAALLSDEFTGSCSDKRARFFACAGMLASQAQNCTRY
ncbi:uncharacterized protein B0I36DRAFT_73379 [Microdochium trichocladiopsis]|uniref:Uncharacterized protein n=1 Tax=Microdochium trichocladiopsis TaxID=1682393 RepID=A0A9P8YFD4_9PEZI|nr:uncharacterized protein B0I36DRAFT_73379 [Microdochium trichocladiopsis]KAH7037971.1 hypothetical protein B0I36DRAFT_73379 [Microdochium trichocladiopsis]